MKSYNIELTATEIMLIVQSCGGLPYNQVVEMMTKLKSQLIAIAAVQSSAEPPATIG